MLKGDVLDTLVIRNSQIVYKKHHQARTEEAFFFLNNRAENLTACYNEIEKSYCEKIHTDECLRIVFSATSPSEYKTEIRKIEKMGNEISLSIVFSQDTPGPEKAYKWENRDDWNLLLKNKVAAADDILVINNKSQITETSRFNIFCYDPNSAQLYTPKLDSGCLNGAFRRFALNDGPLDLPLVGKVTVIEKNINYSELNHYKLYVGNSVRGLLTAKILS